jgi:hypothetical protein
MTHAILTAPWTDDQVESLNRYQQEAFMHPFTCINSHTFLRATTDGWVCDECDYKQNWCHAFMADWSWQKCGLDNWRWQNEPQ